MNENHVDIANAIPVMEDLEGQGKTAMLVSIDGQYAGFITVADTIKETSKEAISRLKDMGIDVIMITGDNQRTAHTIQSNWN